MDVDDKFNDEDKDEDDDTEREDDDEDEDEEDAAPDAGEKAELDEGARDNTAGVGAEANPLTDNAEDKDGERKTEDADDNDDTDEEWVMDGVDIIDGEDTDDDIEEVRADAAGEGFISNKEGFCNEDECSE